MDAPKPTLAKMANGATKGHTGDDEGRRRKSMGGGGLVTMLDVIHVSRAMR